MFKQMNIFDFMDKPQAPDVDTAQEPICETSLFDNIFKRIIHPVVRCANCLCNYCSNNVEGNIAPGELVEPCFNCDECRDFSGNSQHSWKCKNDCSNFMISFYGVASKRKRIKTQKT